MRRAGLRTDAARRLRAAERAPRRPEGGGAQECTTYWVSSGAGLNDADMDCLLRAVRAKADRCGRDATRNPHGTQHPSHTAQPERIHILKSIAATMSCLPLLTCL